MSVFQVILEPQVERLEDGLDAAPLARSASPFNMCMVVAAPRLYAVATKNSLYVSALYATKLRTSDRVGKYGLLVP